MTTIPSFINRLKKIGINVELLGNYPWVYLDKVNGFKVHERYQGNHGFTVFFRGVRINSTDRMTDTTLVFTKIREMLTEEGRIKDHNSWLDEDF